MARAAPIAGPLGRTASVLVEAGPDVTVTPPRIADPRSCAEDFEGTASPRPNGPGNAKILATTYFPERLPSQYLRRWRA